MSKFKLYTVYMANGTIVPLYGISIENALDSAGYNLEYVSENVKDYREGLTDSLKFINGKWYDKDSKVTIPIQEIHQN